MGTNPLLFLDSAEIASDTFQQLNPFDISSITVVLPKSAKKLFGDRGDEGAVYVTTVKFAKQTYWAFFCTKSKDYKQLISSP